MMNIENKLADYKLRIERSNKSILSSERSIAQILLYQRIVWEEQNVLAKHVSAGGNRWYEIECLVAPQHLGISKMYTRGRSYLSDLQGRTIYRAWYWPGHPESGEKWTKGPTVQKAIDNYEKQRSAKPWPTDPQKAMQTFLNREEHETDRSAGL